MPHFGHVASDVPMRILVTGASGFVGSALIPRLAADGHVVRGYGRSAARITAAVDEVVEGDAALGTGLDRALAAADHSALERHIEAQIRDWAKAWGERD